MAEEFLTHITVEGESYQSLSTRYFGNPFESARIIAANPSAPITSRLSGGIALSIPIVEVAEIIDDSELPPWRRSGLR